MKAGALIAEFATRSETNVSARLGASDWIVATEGGVAIFATPPAS